MGRIDSANFKLARLGLTNKDTEDLGVLATASPVHYVPFCTSVACAGKLAWSVASGA